MLKMFIMDLLKFLVVQAGVAVAASAVGKGRVRGEKETGQAREREGEEADALELSRVYEASFGCVCILPVERSPLALFT